jgi:hypothetical protein
VDALSAIKPATALSELCRHAYPKPDAGPKQNAAIPAQSRAATSCYSVDCRVLQPLSPHRKRPRAAKPLVVYGEPPPLLSCLASMLPLTLPLSPCAASRSPITVELAGTPPSGEATATCLCHLPFAGEAPFFTAPLRHRRSCHHTAPRRRCRFTGIAPSSTAPSPEMSVNIASKMSVGLLNMF